MRDRRDLLHRVPEALGKPRCGADLRMQQAHRDDAADLLVERLEDRDVETGTTARAEAIPSGEHALGGVDAASRHGTIEAIGREVSAGFACRENGPVRAKRPDGKLLLASLGIALGIVLV